MKIFLDFDLRAEKTKVCIPGSQSAVSAVSLSLRLRWPTTLRLSNFIARKFTDWCLIFPVFSLKYHFFIGLIFLCLYVAIIAILMVIYSTVYRRNLRWLCPKKKAGKDKKKTVENKKSKEKNNNEKKGLFHHDAWHPHHLDHHDHESHGHDGEWGSKHGDGWGENHADAHDHAHEAEYAKGDAQDWARLDYGGHKNHASGDSYAHGYANEHGDGHGEEDGWANGHDGAHSHHSAHAYHPHHFDGHHGHFDAPHHFDGHHGHFPHHFDDHHLDHDWH
ncbi:hypothetical protein M3Y96_00310200 [Aphelenchoides besseyi]|nr:hypothetical protein M3Y96_00310200 [Aphelenchoides besseyi]